MSKLKMLTNLHNLAERERIRNATFSDEANNNLLAAVRACDLARVSKALFEGANPCFAEPLDAQRPDSAFLSPLLHVACEKNEPHIANFLLENGADVEQTNAVGSTALHVAAGRGALEAVRVALKFTANVRAQNAIGSTPLHCAAFAGAAEICAALLLEDTRPAEFLEMRNLCGACAADVAADGSVRKVLEGFKGGGKRGNDPERKNVGEAKRDGQNGGVKTGKVKSEAAGDRKGGIE